jgi:hypothetical protein
MASALQPLRDGVWPLLDERSERERRQRIAARVVALSRQLPMHRARRQRFALCVAIAALVGAGTLVLYLNVDAGAAAGLDAAPTAELRLVGGHASVRRGTALHALGTGRLALASDSELVTQAEEEAELGLTSDTAVSVSPSTELGIVRDQPTSVEFEEHVRLRRGSVALKVPKLGTRGHAASGAARRQGRARVESSADAAPRSSAPARRRTHAARPALASQLAAQNSLLEAAELAQKNGMTRLALLRLETLIARYPDAELAHNARVERFRLLRLVGRGDDAVAAARAYLERHPGGFARDEAEHLIESLSATVER